MAAAEENFNPFVDDEDAVEDSSISELPDYVEREVSLEYLPESRAKPTQEELEEELPPETVYDFEEELQKIIADMARSDEPLPLLQESLPDPAIGVLTPVGSALETPAPLDASEEPTAVENEEDFELASLLTSLSIDEETSPLEEETSTDDFYLESTFPDLIEEPLAGEAEAIPPAPTDFSEQQDLQDLFPELYETIEDDPLSEEASLDENLEVEEVASPALVDYLPVEQDDDEDEFELEHANELEDDFIPPANPFAMPSDLEDEEASKEEDSEEVVQPTPLAVGDEASEDKKKPKVKKPKKELIPGGLKAKLAEVKANIKSDLKGGDAVDGTPATSMGPSSKKGPPKNVLTGEDQAADKERRAQVKTSNKLKELLAKVFKPYSALAGFVANLLMKILGLLEKIPVVGRYATLASEKRNVISVVAHLIPVVIVVSVLTWHGSGKYGPTDSELTFPDGGAAEFGAFAYDGSTNKATGEAKNTGEVIAKVTPVFTVYAIAPTLNPLSLFYPEPVGECRGGEVNVPIGETLPIAVTCDANIGGFRKEVSGELLW